MDLLKENKHLVTLDGENVQEIGLEDFLPLEVVQRNSKEN